MIYGSSPIYNPTFTGVTGKTGPTGPQGFRGPAGPSIRGSTGNTGPSIIGMTLNSGGFIVTSFDDNTTATAVSKLKGETGNYYLFADADVLSVGFNIVHGVSYFVDLNSDGYPENVIRFKGFTTGSPDVITIRNSDSTAQNNLTIDYSIFNVSYLQVSGGSTGQLVYNKPGDIQFGLTGSQYSRLGVINGVVNTQIANYSEKITFVDAQFNYLDATTGFYYWNIDWEQGNIVKLNPYDSTGKVVVSQILNIRAPSNELSSRGLTIIIPSGITSSSSFSTLYTATDNLSAIPNINNIADNISWPLGIPPCITQNVDILNLISIGNIWHADFSHLGFTFSNSSLDLIGDISKTPTKYPVTEDLFSCARGSNVFGACCPAICGATGYETIEILCNGIFYPGMTLSGTCDNICQELGVCCLKYNDTSVTRVNSFVPFCECSALAENSSVVDFIWTPRLSQYNTVEDINCQNAFNRIGACCNGVGGCQVISEEQCNQSSGYYQGSGFECQLTSGLLRCSGGSGGCCDQPGRTCINYLGQQCIEEGKLYFGNGIPCSEFGCTGSIFIDCYRHLNGIVLRDGDEIEDGVVVGIFNPNRATCYGNTAFGGGYYPSTTYLTGTTEAENLFSFLTDGSEKSAGLYQSAFSSKFGYGFNRPDFYDCDMDSWLLIVSKYPVIITADLINPLSIDPASLSNPLSYVWKFTWSHGGTYFGNIIEENGTDTPPETLPPGSGVFPGDSSRDEGWYTFRRQLAETMGGSVSNISVNGTRVPVDVSNAQGTSFGITYNMLTVKDKLKIFYPTPGDPLNFNILTPVAQTSDFVSGSGFLQFSGINPTNTQANCPSGISCDWSTVTLEFSKDPLEGNANSAANFVYQLPVTYEYDYYGNVYSFTQIPQFCIDQQSTGSIDPYGRNPVYRSGHGPFWARTTMNGKWQRNWGLYNTIRMVCAERHAHNSVPNISFKYSYNFGTTFNPNFDQNTEFFGDTDQSSGEAISIFNRVKSPGLYYPKASQWYIPSIDELSFIANKIANANLNGIIAGHGGVPIGDSTVGAAGWVWSSTGTFDEGITLEYIQTVSTNAGTSAGYYPVKHGSKAWAMNFGDQTDVTNIKIKKESRLAKFEVRPVRLIRCDGQYYDSTTAPARLSRFWKMPSLAISDVIYGPSGSPPL